MKNKQEDQLKSITSYLIECIVSFYSGFKQTITAPRYIRRSYVGYFVPVFAAYRLRKKRNWNYIHQLQVVYRYAFWRGKT